MSVGRAGQCGRCSRVDGLMFGGLTGWLYQLACGPCLVALRNEAVRQIEAADRERSALRGDLAAVQQQYGAYREDRKRSDDLCRELRAEIEGECSALRAELVKVRQELTTAQIDRWRRPWRTSKGTSVLARVRNVAVLLRANLPYGWDRGSAMDQAADQLEALAHELENDQAASAAVPDVTEGPCGGGICEYWGQWSTICARLTTPSGDRGRELTAR